MRKAESDMPNCVLCGDKLSNFEIIAGSNICMATQRMLAADPDLLTGCERDLNTPLVFSDSPPPTRS